MTAAAPGLDAVVEAVDALRLDERRERFVSLCHDIDVQKLTFEAYMNKRLVAARPMAHLKIGLKNLAHLTRLISEDRV